MISYVRETYFVKGVCLLITTCQSAVLWNLFHGAESVQRSRINHAMSNMFKHMTFVFGAFTVTPFLGIVSTDYAVVFSNYCTWPFIIGFLYSLWKFTDECMNMDNGKKPFKNCDKIKK